jgi:hypothetical protein
MAKGEAVVLGMSILLRSGKRCLLRSYTYTCDSDDGVYEQLNASGITVPTFTLLAALSGKVPLVAIVAGNCFAGNAALVGVCDVIIATENSSLGMAGPAMIEGGGLGVFKVRKKQLDHYTNKKLNCVIASRERSGRPRCKLRTE